MHLAERLARLAQVWRTLFGSRQKGDKICVLPSGLPCCVNGEEDLARFLKSKKHFSVTNNTVKHAAFIPNPRDGKTSVFRHSGEPTDALWNIGRISLGEDVPIRGAAFIRAETVRAEHLEVAASEPPPRHANIENWPSADDPELAKAARKEVAMALASQARLLVRSQ